MNVIGKSERLSQVTMIIGRVSDIAVVHVQVNKVFKLVSILDTSFLFINFQIKSALAEKFLKKSLKNFHQSVFGATP